MKLDYECLNCLIGLTLESIAKISRKDYSIDDTVTFKE